MAKRLAFTKMGICQGNIKTTGGMVVTCINNHEVTAPWWLEIPRTNKIKADAIKHCKDAVMCPKCADVIDLLI